MIFLLPTMLLERHKGHLEILTSFTETVKNFDAHCLRLQPGDENLQRNY